LEGEVTLKSARTLKNMLANMNERSSLRMEKQAVKEFEDSVEKLKKENHRL
jgi:hypothetical protein